MRADKISLFDLFEKQRRYLVPLFQRGYVWRRTEQWEPLWQDVLDQVASLAEPVSPAYRPPRKHFLGAIVLNQAYTRILQVPSTEVIDGQQRLMTLQVLLAALRDAVAGILNPYLAGILERLTTNPGPFLDPDEQFKVWPTGAFRDDLRSIITAGPQRLWPTSTLSDACGAEAFPLVRRWWRPICTSRTRSEDTCRVGS